MLLNDVEEVKIATINGFSSLIGIYHDKVLVE